MKNIYSKVTAGLSVLPTLILPATAMAQLSVSQEQVDLIGNTIGADAGTNLPTLVGNIIRVLLSTLGIILVALIVYAGFLYLTAMGETEKVKKAKTLLTNAIIGMVIIVAAYAISSFVIDALTSLT